MTFTDPIIGGESKLIRNAIQSPDYVTGVSGWSINRDGTAEFNDGTFRGTLSIRNPTTGRGFVLSPSSGDLEMYPQDSLVGLNVLPATLQNTLIDVVGVGQFLSSWRSGSVNFQDSARIRLDSESADGASSPATIYLDATRILAGGNIVDLNGQVYRPVQVPVAAVPASVPAFSLASGVQNATQAITFAVPYPVGVIPVVLCSLNSGSGQVRGWEAAALNITNTGFDFFIRSWAAGSGATTSAVNIGGTYTATRP